MLALADAVDGGRLPNAEIALIVSDHSKAAGLQRASRRAKFYRVHASMVLAYQLMELRAGGPGKDQTEL